jgi:osmotically-inducible protein OsmY
MTGVLDQQRAGVFQQDPVVREAMDCLHENPELTGELISCGYREGMLILRGQVATYYQKRIAQELVRRLDGVVQVVNNIEVADASLTCTCRR